jgi:hypothetical protein
LGPPKRGVGGGVLGEQEAARHDLRRAAYANYLRESYGFLLQIQLKHQKVASVSRAKKDIAGTM